MKKAQKNKSPLKAKPPITASKKLTQIVKRAKNSKKIVTKLSAKKPNPVKAKSTRRKTQTKKATTPVELLPMVESPKAAEVASSHLFDETGGLSTKTNSRFSQRNLFRHQSR